MQEGDTLLMRIPFSIQSILAAIPLGNGENRHTFRLIPATATTANAKTTCPQQHQRDRSDQKHSL